MASNLDRYKKDLDALVETGGGALSGDGSATLDGADDMAGLPDVAQLAPRCPTVFARLRMASFLR